MFYTLIQPLANIWNKISRVGINEGQLDYRLSRQIILANQVALLGTVVPQLYNVFYYLHNYEFLKPVILVNLIGSTVNFSTFFFNYYGQYRIGKFIISVSPNIQIFFLTYFMSTASGMHLLHIMMISFVLFLFSNEKRSVMYIMLIFTILLHVIEFIFFNLNFSPIILDAVTLKYFYLTISITVFLLIIMFFSLFYREIQFAENALEKEHQRSEKLLLNILPEEIAEKLKENPSFTAEEFKSVTILFADIVGFTQIANQVESTKLVNNLNKIFTLFDAIAERHGLEKIKTIGDAYMVAGGIPIPSVNHTKTIAKMAIEMIDETGQYVIDGQKLNIRIGFHTGPVIAGVIGTRKFSYDVWGHAVNVASRLESHGQPGQIHVSEDVYQILKDEYDFKHRGQIQVKGLGEMETYFLSKK